MKEKNPKQVQPDIKDLKKKYESETSESEPGPPKTLKSKLSSFKVRMVSSIVMVLGFILIISAGHFYCSLLVILINICIFKELISLKTNQEREAKIPFFHLISWYFFICTELAITFLFISQKAIKSPTINKLFKYRFLLIFSMFIAGFIIFVISLRKGQYKYQFKMFAWTIISCVLVISQTTTVIMNIYDGIIWFLLPASLVIVNDCSAYIFGVLFGRTPLIQLSPNKTLEGFIGGLLSTVFWAYLVRFMQISNFLAQYNFLLCPQGNITMVPFTFVDCDNKELLLRNFRRVPFTGTEVLVSNLEIYAMVLGFFAGFIAPFGGFFASGVKRAFKIKDFGDSIPGHGGMTDRMDCQIMMGMFTCVWLNSMIMPAEITVGTLLAQILSLTFEDQVRVYEHLKNSLELVQ